MNLKKIHAKIENILHQLPANIIVKINLLHRNRFRQISRLVDVAAAADGDVIREQLQRDDREDRAEQIACFGNLDDVIRNLLTHGVAFGQDRNDDAVA